MLAFTLFEGLCIHYCQNFSGANPIKNIQKVLGFLFHKSITVFFLLTSMSPTLLLGLVLYYVLLGSPNSGIKPIHQTFISSDLRRPKHKNDKINVPQLRLSVPLTKSNI